MKNNKIIIKSLIIFGVIFTLGFCFKINLSVAYNLEGQTPVEIEEHFPSVPPIVPSTGPEAEPGEIPTPTITIYEFETGIPLIPGAEKGKSLFPISISQLIAALIKVIIPIAGILAFAMIIYAGFQYLTAGGNTAQQKDAQERITSAIIGLILLFAFYIILYTINPDILKSPSETAAPTPPAVTPPAVTPPDQTPSNNLVNIKNYQPAPILSGELQGYDGVFLDQSLANDLSDITKNETYAPFVVTDACITDALPCLTTENTRPLGACHYYGTCVDIDSPTGDNKTLITIFNQNGLAVLEEGDHLHISLLEATGYGSYQDSGYSGCTTEKKCCFTLEGEKACWYSPT